MGSHDEATPNKPKEENSSLAARRARLRGSLVNKAMPADPYNATTVGNSKVEAKSSNAANSRSTFSEPDQNTDQMDSPSMSTSNSPSDPNKQTQSKQFTLPAEPPMPDDSEFEYDPTAYNAGMFAKNSSTFGTAFSSVGASTPMSPLDYEYAKANQSAHTPSFNGNTPMPVYGSVSGQTWTNPIGSPVEPAAPAAQVAPEDLEHTVPVTPIMSEPEEETKPIDSGKKGRGKSKDKSRDNGADTTVVEESTSSEDDVNEQENELARLAQEQVDREIEAEFQAPAVVPMHMRENANPSLTPNLNNVQLPDPLTFATSTTAQGQVLELLNNMDQAMGACAMNLSTLQKTAGEQTEALKALTRTLEHQTFSELGLNLTSMMESLAAALEPMKAVGELVPAIDSLVSELGAKVSRDEPVTRLSPDQLLLNLADQLGAGTIDPWTFKSAYMAVFPSEQAADLLRRLVDLLGTQRLSGEVFRSAYDAVQSNELPPPVKRAATTGVSGTVSVVQDEALLEQLEQLKTQQGSFEQKMQSREHEYSQMLGAKEQELHDAQELLHSRWDEFNTRYDELSDSLVKRDEILQEKETEIARKESENVQLRAQMEELRDMMTDLQKQFTSGQASQKAEQNNFFDPAGGQVQASKTTQSLFDAEPAKPLFQGQSDVTETNIPISPQRPHVAPPQPQPALSQGIAAPGRAQQQPPPVPPQPQMQQQNQQAQLPQPAPNVNPQQGVPTQPQINQQASSQAVPRQNSATTPFGGAGAGSYGSGVRAQVFEVIVRQALAGAPWREICAGPMQVNNIAPDEVEVEVKRRQALLKK